MAKAANIGGDGVIATAGRLVGTVAGNNDALHSIRVEDLLKDMKDVGKMGNEGSFYIALDSSEMVRDRAFLSQLVIPAVSSDYLSVSAIRVRYT